MSSIFHIKRWVNFSAMTSAIDLYDEKYNYASGSKANRMRGFWIAADNPLVGESIVKLIEYIENQILLADLQKSNFPQELITKGKTNRESTSRQATELDDLTEDEFLKQEFKKISIDSLGLSGTITNIIKQRLSYGQIWCMAVLNPAALLPVSFSSTPSTNLTSAITSAR